MSLIAMLILGALIGWAASVVMGRDEGIIASIVIGVIGSFIGGFVSTLFTGGDQAVLALSWSGLIWSFIGSVILVALLNAFQGRRNHAM